MALFVVHRPLSLSRLSALPTAVVTLNGPHHAKACLRVYAERKDPAQPAYPYSLSANRIILNTTECMTGEQIPR